MTKKVIFFLTTTLRTLNDYISGHTIQNTILQNLVWEYGMTRSRIKCKNCHLHIIWTINTYQFCLLDSRGILRSKVEGVIVHRRITNLNCVFGRVLNAHLHNLPAWVTVIFCVLIWQRFFFFISCKIWDMSRVYWLQTK